MQPLAHWLPEDEVLMPRARRREWRPITHPQGRNDARREGRAARHRAAIFERDEHARRHLVGLDGGVSPRALPTPPQAQHQVPHPPRRLICRALKDPIRRALDARTI
jgi:hypothetical protein